MDGCGVIIIISAISADIEPVVQVIIVTIQIVSARRDKIAGY